MALPQWMMLAALAAAPARAVEPGMKNFQLPDGDAMTTLKQFVEQSGEQVFYFVDKVRGVTTHAVQGRMNARTALELMLQDTRLRAVQDDRTGALSVIEREPRKALPPPPAAPSPPARVSPGSPDEIILLPQFSVSGTKADAYRPAEATSAARIRGSLLDTPLSINVVTRELLDDIGANSMYEATRYFSGVSNGRGTGPGGIMDRQNFRGFESFTKTIDNFSSQLLPTNNGFVAVFEPQFIERAEVVLGPDAILAPTGSPGGSMNIITKSPQFQRGGDLTVALGNYNAGKITVDSTGPLGDGNHWAYRVIGDYQDATTYVPGSIRQWNVSPQLTYRFSDSAELTLKYFGAQWELTGAMANANDNGWVVTDPGSIRGTTIAGTPPPSSGFTYNGWNGNTTWSHTFDRVNIVSGQFTTTLADRISMRLGAEALFDNNVGDSGFPSASPTETFDPATGQVIALSSLNPAALPEVARYNHGVSRDVQLQNDYAASFHPGEVSIQPVAGWTYQQAANTSNTRQFTLPPANLFAGTYAPAKPPLSAYAPSAKTKSNAWQGQVYSLTRVGFYDDRVLLTGGVSRTWVNSNTYTYNIADLSAPPVLQTLSGYRDTYLGGILFKPAKNISLYYAFSSNAALTTSNKQPLWQQGQQHEFGLKSEFFHQRLAFTAAHFQIAQTNLVTPNPAFNVDPAHNAPNTLSDQANRGFEFNLVGGLTKNLSVIASFTEMKLRDPFGRRIRNVPDQLANLLLNYRFTDGALKNFSVFAAVVHVGNSAGENAQNDPATGVAVTPLGVPTQPGYYVAAWTVYNAGASYRWDRFRFNLNIDNVLNSKFAWQPASRLSVSPYPGATVRLTTDIKF
ncbi:MAG TPA: TonB-dependent receptor plug domain-containing protein [Opitutaceae bacterium]|jgi:iron complex outermembrane receptor protein|nr:TonB-dependent receptor plug domain-containing protein [Opitutaceae bacterium]